MPDRHLISHDAPVARTAPRYIEHIAPFFTLDGLGVIYELNTKG